MEVTLPYKWFPREYQLNLWSYLETATAKAERTGYRGQGARAVAVWHRRAGKDYTAIHWIAREAFRRRGLYWHVLPTYRQGNKVVWEGQTRTGVPFTDAFPGSLIDRTRDDQMKIWLINGSQYQVVGGDDPDKLVGANPIGVVFSEWSIMNPYIWELVRPILAENGGWALWLYTPRGRNHGYKLLQDARRVGWFHEILPYQKTGVLTEEQVQAEIDAGMAPEVAAQEFECSFDAPLEGSFYGDLLTNAERDGRICHVRAADRPVDTAWDLGIGDATGIWFFQDLGREVRWLKYHFAHGKGIEDYVDRLQKFRDQYSWVYGRHLAPHDARHRSIQTKHDLVTQARNFGLRFKVLPRESRENGIQAVRSILPISWFDEDLCDVGLQGLREYRKEKIEGEFDPEGNQMYEDVPVHNWASHPADAARVAACSRTRQREEIKRVLAPKIAIA